MKLYAIVCNGTHWIHFCNNYAEAFHYVNTTLRQELSESPFIRNLKVYTRHKKLFASYEHIMMQEPKKDVYGFQEVTLADVLNWMLSDTKSLWVMQNIQSE